MKRNLDKEERLGALYLPLNTIDHLLSDGTTSKIHGEGKLSSQRKCREEVQSYFGWNRRFGKARAKSRNALQRKPDASDRIRNGREERNGVRGKNGERRSYGRERVRYATLLAALWSLLLKVSWGSYRSGEAFYSRGTLCIFTTGVRLRVRVLHQDLWGLRACYNGAECEHPSCQYSSIARSPDTFWKWTVKLYAIDRIMRNVS